MPEFGEGKEEKNLPPNSGRYNNTTRPLQSSTSFRKPATVSRKRNAGMPRLTVIAAKST